MKVRSSPASLYLQNAWRRHPFQLALCISLLIHLIFLSIRWGAGEIQSRRLNTSLSVVLVNASNKTAPQEANRLAQADLQGGGRPRGAAASAGGDAEALSAYPVFLSRTPKRSLGAFSRAAGP